MGATVDPAQKSSISTSPIDPRSGAAKKLQGSVAVHPAMKNSQSFAASPGASGSGPDASSPDVLDPSPRNRLKNQPQILRTPWGAMDNLGPNRSKLDASAGKVIGQAVLSGSTKLPATATPAAGAGPKDPN